MTRTEWSAELALPISEERDHIEGPADAPVTLVEYGDYECPYCGAAYPIVKEVQARMGETLRFVFRNFPITTSHPHAEHAAEAAEAAAAQGRFWQMHDYLYEHQRGLTDKDLHQYAEELGLDVDRFDSELAEHVHGPRVREDFMSGVRSGVNGTPTFYINGRRHDDSYDAGDVADGARAGEGVGAMLRVVVAALLAAGAVLASAAAAAAPAQPGRVFFLRGEQLAQVPRAGTTPAVALRHLIAGPTRAERARGFRSYVPPKTKLLGVRVVNGIATVDFDSRFVSSKNPGSLLARLSEVVRTLTGFMARRRCSC